MSTPRSRSAEPVETGVPLLQVRLVTPEQDFRVPTMDLYRSGQDWDGLYVNGRLAYTGHSDSVCEALVDAITNLVVHEPSDGGADFMRGSSHRAETARTEDDIVAHRVARHEAQAACPDGGGCHHLCPGTKDGHGMPCWRVLYAGPLSVAHYPDDDWPGALRQRHLDADRHHSHTDGPPLDVLAHLADEHPNINYDGLADAEAQHRNAHPEEAL